MGLSRAIQGARNTGLSITWTTDDGTAQNLTGATMSGTIENDEGTVRAVVGTLALVTASSGIFSWAYDAVDVATPGRYLVQFKATYSTYDLTYPEVWVVEPAQVVS